MRLVLILLVVVGFVAFATSLPVNNKDEDSKSQELEQIDEAETPEDITEEKRHKRGADTTSSSSEESNEDKKPSADGKVKPLAAGVVETTGEGASGATKTGAEVVKAAPVALRRKRCVNTTSEESNEDSKAMEELFETTSKAEVDQETDVVESNNSEDNEKNDDDDKEDENEIKVEEDDESET